MSEGAEIANALEVLKCARHCRGIDNASTLADRGQKPEALREDFIWGWPSAAMGKGARQTKLARIPGVPNDAMSKNTRRGDAALGISVIGYALRLSPVMERRTYDVASVSGLTHGSQEVPAA